ncbi:MAG TPA: alpha-hydroxy acid oxidase, partial [Candidatus Acidoferrales bacterium]
MNRRALLESLLVCAAGASLLPASRAWAGGLLAQSQNAQGPVAANLFDFEALARQRLSQMVTDYIGGGAGDEITLRRNRTEFDRILLKPRALVDVSKLDTSVEVFGQKLDFPVLLAPTAYHKLVHPEGEAATAVGAGAAGATMVISSFATTSLEDVARAATRPLWFQLYIQPDRAFTRDLVQRAESAGCRALCVTVDTPVLGTRDYEKRSRFNLPPGVERENLKGLGRNAQRTSHLNESEIYSDILDASLTWDIVAWIRSISKLPLILKGILAPEDARLAVQSGADGIIVSNHGARNMDTTPATIEALPAVMDAVGGKMPVLMDGGVRRGT